MGSSLFPALAWPLGYLGCLLEWGPCSWWCPGLHSVFTVDVAFRVLVVVPPPPLYAVPLLWGSFWILHPWPGIGIPSVSGVVL